MRSVYSISILGCGWLGLPLAERLVKEGFPVKGSVTKKEKLDLLKQKKITPFQIELKDQAVEGTAKKEFFCSDLLIINIPPGRKADVVGYHTAQIRQLIKEIVNGTIQHVLFISSSAVYPDQNKEVVETDVPLPDKESGKALLQAEQLLQSQSKFKTSIIRFGGLIGPKRHPGKFLAGKKEVANGDAPINVIHRDDCIELIYGVIQQQAWGEIFNACADIHPSRRTFYTKAAEDLLLEPPSFKQDGIAYKIVNSKKIKERLNYVFKYPDPLDSLKQLLKADES